MAYHCSFVDNVLYGPEDVNEVVGDLVGAGVAPFISKDSYKPSDLNSLTAGMVSSGVQLGGCKVSIVSETKVSVAPGIIYFDNGLRLKVTEAHSINIPKNMDVTIYALYTPSSNKGNLTYINGVSIKKSDTRIPLARIYADGTITDVREFAESKIVTLGTNAIYSIPEDRITTMTQSYNGGYKVAEIDLADINLSRFNYLLYKYANTHEVSEEGYFLVEGYWNFKEDTEKSFLNKYSIINENEAYLYKITKVDNKFVIYIEAIESSGITYAPDPDNVSETLVRINRGKSYFKLI